FFVSRLPFWPRQGKDLCVCAQNDRMNMLQEVFKDRYAEQNLRRNHPVVYPFRVLGMCLSTVVRPHLLLLMFLEILNEPLVDCFFEHPARCPECPQLLQLFDDCGLCFEFQTLDELLPLGLGQMQERMEDELEKDVQLVEFKLVL